MSEEESADWAQLVCLTDAETPPFLISKDKFTIGRAQSCDISHENNKMVSGSHCYILRDESGKVWLYDTSSNGTMLNSKVKLSKGECREIEHGDEFFVVHKKGDENVNIGYVFQDLARLKEEEEDDSGELDQTLEYEDAPPPVDATILDDSINQVDDEEETRSTIKRKRTSTSHRDPSPSGKRTKASHPEVDSTSDTAPPTTTATAVPPTGNTAKSKGSDAESKPSADSAEAKPGKVDDKGEGKGEEKDSGSQKVTKSDGGATGKKGEGKGEEKDSGSQKATKSDGGATGKKGEGGAAEEDVFAETLTCIICQELLYDCVSLQPCMHSFCAGCYSEWMAHSSECPSCRGNVDRINKNHIVNNLVEAYLKEHPEKRRPEEDTKELDAQNKITRDMLYPSRRRRSSSEFENSDDDEDDDPLPALLPPPLVLPPPPPGGALFGFGSPFFGTASNTYRAVCRQCPGQTDQAPGVIGSAIKGFFTGPQTTTATTSSTNTAADKTATPSTSGSGNNDNNDTNNNPEQPSTSGTGPSGEGDYLERDKKTMPVAPPYTCSANQNHVLCQCCLQIFPDRRHAYDTAPDTLPPQQCTICFRAFCHAYWGCRKADCNGCLAKFGDMNFGRKVLPCLILNKYESEIFTNYLEENKLAVRDVLEACMAKLEQGEYSCPDQARYNMTRQTPLCFACGLRNFKPLAYQYRADIPRDQLPAEVTARSNCYWGKNCRTQHNKPAHAMRFNHICEQTRT